MHEFWLPHFRVQVAVLSAANADPEKTVGTDAKASARTASRPTTALFIPLFFPLAPIQLGDLLPNDLALAGRPQRGSRLASCSLLRRAAAADYR